MKKITGYYTIIFAILAFLFIGVKGAYAAFNISVTPYEGGYDLRFSKISTLNQWINKEVKVRITSDINKQYRVIQKLLEPLSDVVGNRIPENNLVVYGLRGTNNYGTMHVETEWPVSLGRTNIYTSNQQGLSDSFILVYRLQVPQGQVPGVYRGRIAYYLEPIDASVSPATVVLNIYCEVETHASIEISTTYGSKVIRLTPGKPEGESCDIAVKINGTFGAQFKILQIAEPLVSSEGNELSNEALEYVASQASRGQVQPGPMSLSSQPQVIYVSSPKGEQDSFIITLRIKDFEKEKAGRYRGRLKYLLEGGGGIKSGLIETLSLEVENPRIFDLIVTPETGGVIQFRNLKPLEPPRIYYVDFEIKTNTGKPFQISQNVLSEFTNKEGKIIPREYFTLRTESLDTKGLLKLPNKTEVKIGDMVLFVSDKLGSPDKFRVIYELGIPLNVIPGDYSTRISYSLSEI